MVIKLENVGIAVDDLEAAIDFFTDLGLILLGRDTVSGEWADVAVGLDGNHANIAMLQMPDGHGRIELFEYLNPKAITSTPTLPNQIGMHRVAFSVDDIDAALDVAAKHGCYPLRGVATYQDVYKLTYVRGPSGIIVMFAEELAEQDVLDEPIPEVALSGQLVCADADEAATVLRHLPHHIELTRAEPGCISFEVHQTDVHVWQVDERFTDDAAFGAHQARVATSEWGRVTAGFERRYSIRTPPADPSIS